MALGIAVLASNAVAAGWGAVGWLRKDARASIVFWPLLRVAQATVVVQVVLGLLLLARGASAPDGLHVAYGIAPLRGHAGQRGDARRASRSASSRRWRTWTRSSAREQVALARRVALGEMGVMTVGALLILTLALRAYQTGG